MKRLIALLLCILCLPVSAFADGEDYLKIEKQTYYDKTKAGFLSQIAGMLSGIEFKQTGGRYAVAMPDEWFSFCDGPYAGNESVMKHTDKHVKGEDGLFETWIDDDFGVDIFNQYILEDAFAEYGCVSSKAVSDGWLKYSIHDMGGGERSVGAYGLIERRQLLPQFAGNGEFGNMYSYLSEPYLATDTLGMNAPGMPLAACELAETFASVTGDRDNEEFAKFFAVLISTAYFESDIQALIRKSSAVFTDGSHERGLIDEIFGLYARYPDDWRKAFTEYEKNHYTEGITTGANTAVNCGFAVLTLLYGGDYMTTARIGSLAGYDCESTCGIALTVLSVMGGSKILPDDVNALIWQDGKGVIINASAEGTPYGQQMHADNLPRVMPVSDIVDKYVRNFEHVLAANGGRIEGDYYLIPKSELVPQRSVPIANCGFENGLDGFTASGKCVLTPMTSLGRYAAKLTENGELYTKVKGLTVGKTYALTAYIHVTGGARAFLFARGNGGVCTAVLDEANAANDAYRAVKRTLVFTASESEMEIGVELVKGDAALSFATVDGLSLCESDGAASGSTVLETNNGKMLRAVLQAEHSEEQYLKLTYANTNPVTVDGKIIINGKGVGACVLSRTSPHGKYADINTVYVPVVLEKGYNTLSIAFGGYGVKILNAELVNK